LQPVDADRLFVARRVLEHDVGEVAALEHLGAGLGEARLVTIGGGQREEARQGGEQGHHRGHQRRASSGRELVGESLQRHDGSDNTRSDDSARLVRAL
jgi:hypothetical protein